MEKANQNIDKKIEEEPKIFEDVSLPVTFLSNFFYFNARKRKYCLVQIVVVLSDYFTLLFEMYSCEAKF